jgi:hypothetical protein
MRLQDGTVVRGGVQPIGVTPRSRQIFRASWLLISAGVERKIASTRPHSSPMSAGRLPSPGRNRAPEGARGEPDDSHGYLFFLITFLRLADRGFAV